MSTWTGSPALPSLLAGQIPQAGTDWLAMLDALHALSDAWSSFTPVWGSSGTLPVLGNGTMNARYIQVGKFVADYGVLTFGSTTTFGTGTWYIALPVVANGSLGMVSSVATLYDNDASTGHRPASWLQNTSTSSTMVSTTGNVDATDPFTWAVNDRVYWLRMYEAA